MWRCRTAFRSPSCRPICCVTPVPRCPTRASARRLAAAPGRRHAAVAGDRRSPARAFATVRCFISYRREQPGRSSSTTTWSRRSPTAPGATASAGARRPRASPPWSRPGLALVARACGPQWRGWGSAVVALALAAVLLGLGPSISRAYGDAALGAVLAGAALPFAFVGGWPTGRRPAADRLGAVLLLVSVLAAVRRGPRAAALRRRRDGRAARRRRRAAHLADDHAGRGGRRAGRAWWPASPRCRCWPSGSAGCRCRRSTSRPPGRPATPTGQPRPASSPRSPGPTKC